MEAPIESLRELYRAVNARDVPAIREVARKLPAALRAGWRGGSGPSFLHLAASEGFIDVCEALVELGVDIDILDPDDHSTPLGSAAGYGRLETARWLLDHGAQVDGRPTSIATPLMTASADGHVDVVRLLLDAGADLNREHLRLPQTALDFAEVYKVKKSGQDLVAALLRERGAIRPYVDRHDWTSVPGADYLQYIEHAIGRVNPAAIPADAGRGRKVTLRRGAIAPKNEFKLLFTVGVARFANTELTLTLPWGWPLNRDSLLLSRFNWPIDLLGRLSGLVGDGERMAHGVAIDANHPALRGVASPRQIVQWLGVNHQSTDVNRDDESSTLLLAPIIAKKPISSEAAAALAAKKAQAKWKALAVPIEAASDDHAEQAARSSK